MGIPPTQCPLALMLDNEAFAENVGGFPKKARAVLLRMLLAWKCVFET